MTPSPFSGYAAQVSDFIARGGSASTAKPLSPHNGPDFEQLAFRLFRIQFEHNAPYRNFCRARGVLPETLEDVADIPAVPTGAFKELEVTCIPPGERVTVFHSSGTTGRVSSRHFHSALSLSIYEKSLLRWFQCQFPSGVNTRAFVCLTPPPAAVPNSSLVHMLEVLRHAFGAPEKCYFGLTGENHTWSLDLPRLREFLLRAARLGTPLFLFGTAFSFVHLLDDLAGQGTPILLPPGSSVMETGGYKGRSRTMPKAQLHAAIARWLGVRREAILCEYGMCEQSSQAYDTPIEGKRYFRFPPWARASILSPETGREVADGAEGLLRILDLANMGSVLAIDTQDIAVRRGEAFELLGRVVDAELRGCSLMAA